MTNLEPNLPSRICRPAVNQNRPLPRVDSPYRVPPLRHLLAVVIQQLNSRRLQFLSEVLPFQRMDLLSQRSRRRNRISTVLNIRLRPLLQATSFHLPRHRLRLRRPVPLLSLLHRLRRLHRLRQATQVDLVATHQAALARPQAIPVGLKNLQLAVQSTVRDRWYWSGFHQQIWSASKIGPSTQVRL
jgi:hypothetical protein